MDGWREEFIEYAHSSGDPFSPKVLRSLGPAPSGMVDAAQELLGELMPRPELQISPIREFDPMIARVLSRIEPGQAASWWSRFRAWVCG